MRTAIYVRVSTQEQAEEGYSIKAQLERLQAYATSQNWKVVKTYIDDGQSAKNMNRTELTNMFKDMKKNLFDCILVYRLDRLTRSVLDLYTMLNTFEEYNIKFKSATEVYDTTNAMGRLFITLVAALAQWERENLGERIRMGMMQKAKEGKWTVSTPPIGYDKGEDDTLIINENEAIIVKEIYKLYLSNRYGTGKVAKVLNQKNMKTKSGAFWNMNTVNYVLKNPIYKGTLRYNYRVNKEQYFELDGVVPPIITEDEYNEAQKLIENRSKHHPRKATSPHIFTTVLKCGRCGGIMSGKQSHGPNKKYVAYSYYCVNAKYGRCDQRLIAQNFLEVQFIKLLDSIELQDYIDDEISKQEAPLFKTEGKIKELKKELIEVEKRRSKWQYAWANDLIDLNDLKKRIQEDDKEKERIEKEILDIELRNFASQKQSSLSEALEDLKEAWSTLELHEKKKFVELIIDEISVDKTSYSRKPDSVSILDIKFL